MKASLLTAGLLTLLTMTGLGCSSPPTQSEFCGDGILNGNEECDDGNSQEGDGCDRNCRVEEAVTAVCGNGLTEPGEQCDDGNTQSGDGCNANCRFEFCGDGIVSGSEACDNGGQNSDTIPDACRTDCSLPICGDGVTDTGEECDDGNNLDGDGCDPNCVAFEVCGDGIVQPGNGEQCDDGNTIEGDGCDLLCQIEPDFLPDLVVLADRLEPSIRTKNIDPNDCELAQGCATGTGLRTILEFNTFSANLGPGDLLGGPQNHPELYEPTACGFQEWVTYSRFFLKDANGNIVAQGHKPSFCLADLHQVDPNAPGPFHSCGPNQGISVGWADIYSKGLRCQYIDITDVPPGDYTLEVELNFEQLLPEANFDNNIAAVPVTIP